jgi:hypothetical protein
MQTSKIKDIFNFPNSSGRTMALGVHSASNRNENQEFSLGLKAGWLTAICEQIV